MLSLASCNARDLLDLIKEYFICSQTWFVKGQTVPPNVHGDTVPWNISNVKIGLSNVIEADHDDAVAGTTSLKVELCPVAQVDPNVMKVSQRATPWMAKK